MRHGGKILVDQLKKLGVRRVFSVPGESFLPVLDGLYESEIQNVVCRHEGGAAMMAEAMGKMTGEPGVCFVTRGPGACNASSGVHVAMQDSTPMVMFVGQINSRHRDREAFQEVDYRQMFGGLAKWVAEVDHVERLPEYIARAWRVAMAGRPGPVVLALPEDVLSAEADIEDWTGVVGQSPATVPESYTGILDKFLAAKRPMIIIGGPHWSSWAAMALDNFARNTGAPVVSNFRRQDYIDNRSTHYVGDLNVGVNPKLAARLRESDCLLLLGSRLGDIETQGFELVDPGDPKKTILHVHPDPAEIGRLYGAADAVVSPADHAIEMLSIVLEAKGREPQWLDQTEAARAEYEDWVKPQESPGEVKQEQVILWLSQHLSEDGLVASLLFLQAVWDAIGSNLWIHGLWVPGGGCGLD